MEILVSVLIPVCNTEKYVRECVESVRRQTLRDIEILCLDDGSTDKSAGILDGLAKEDERIRVIHKENSGYGATMNLGLRLAQGKYVGIVESDDYVEPDMFRSLYERAEEGYDFVKSNFALFWKDGQERVFEEVYLIDQKDMYERSLSREEMKRLFRGYVANCTGIYRRSFLNENKICHNETPGASYQDLGFFFQIMMKAERGYLSQRSYYRYRQDNQASSINSKSKVYCIFDEHYFIYQKLLADMEMFQEYLPVYQIVCFQGYLFNVRRIAPPFRLGFLERAQSECRKFKEKGELDLSAFGEDEKEALSLIMDDPAGYLDKVFQMPAKLRKALDGYTDVIIYGAGARGHEVCSWLKEEGTVLGNIVYAVSDEVPEKRYKDGIELVCIHELEGNAQNAAVIVAVTRRYQEEMLENLNRLGFKNIITLE